MSILIFGHKNPDTDSVCSSIAYSYLKNKLSLTSMPVTLGPIKSEARFVLNKFHNPVPMEIQNVKNQIKNIDIAPSEAIYPNNSYLKAIQVMEKSGINTAAIVDECGYLVGLTTIKDIALELIKNSNDRLNTTYSNLIVQLNSRFLTKICDLNQEVNGTISIASDYYEHIENTIDSETVSIVGDVYKTIDELIDNRVRLIIVCSSSSIPEHIIDKANHYGVPILQTDKSTYLVSRLISQCNTVKGLMKTNKIIKVNLNDGLSDFRNEIKDYEYRNYPVIDYEGKFIGFIDRKALYAPKRNKVILVDHNEESQSAEGLREAEILEIIDHHKLGGLTSVTPINFINLPVGSTCTIIYQQFKINQVPIPEDIAGILISGILSDTLNFKSPTSTKSDIEAVKELNKIVQIDMDQHFNAMYSAASSTNNLTILDILSADSKEFVNKDTSIRIAQFFTSNIEFIQKNIQELENHLDNDLSKGNCILSILVITDILREGSYFFFSSKEKQLLEHAFKIPENQGMFVEGIVSRKKQIVPQIIKTLNAE